MRPSLDSDRDTGDQESGLRGGEMPCIWLLVGVLLGSGVASEKNVFARGVRHMTFGEFLWSRRLCKVTS